jgi:hypothetical protein
MWRFLPTTYPAKAALPFSSSKNWLHSCRLSIAEKCGANNRREQSKAPLTVQYEIHTSAQPIQQRIGEVQVTIEVWVHAKVPSHHVSCKSSAALRLFKESTALLQTIDYRKVWGKQPMGTEQGSTHCLVWNSHKCPANTAKNWRRTNNNQSMGACEGAFPWCILQKQRRPSALQTMNCTAAD